MSVRVHELAKRCGISNAEMMEKLRAMKYPVKTVSSTVDNITAESLIQEYGYVPPPAPPPPDQSAQPPSAPPAEASAPPAPPPTVPAKAAPAPAAAPEPPQPAAPATPSQPPAVAPSPAPAAPATVPPPPKVAPRKVATPKVEPTKVVMAPPKPAVAQPPPAKGAAAPKPVAPASTGPTYVLDERGRKVIRMKPPVIVRDLAERLGLKPHVLLSELMQLNVFANLNEPLGEDVARKVCERRGFVFELEKRGARPVMPPKPKPAPPGAEPSDLVPRPPVVTVLGHVDHGKTSLLDAIRKTDVAAHESGGITQHIGASVVRTSDGRTITFLDTPGHEAFTKMRARGAHVTDIAVLVVAADDGVMPQTLEAINHARAANVPIVVAINKCDLPAANPDRVKKQLQERGLTPESWGGDTIMVEVSATTKKNVDELLEMILLQAEMMELKANPKCPAKGNVIEAQLEPGLGPTATVLVREGTLKTGDALVCGPHMAKVRALIDDKGKRVKEAGPSMPVKVVGFSGLPDAGAAFEVVKNEKVAREISEQRALALRAASASATARRGTKLEDLLSQLEAGEKKKLHLVLKADVQGSLEAIRDALGKLKSDKVELEVIHGAVGNITENDVLLASASDAVIIGFRVKPESGVTDLAKREDVQIKLYTIIYELLEQVEEAMEGMLEPEAREVLLGRAEVRQIFQLSKGARVAGCYVSSGRIVRSARARLLRRKAVQYEGRILSLKHFQDDVKEVKAGSECGLRLENFQEFEPGDVIECYMVEKVATTL